MEIEVFYLNGIDLLKDDEIKSFIENLFNDLNITFVLLDQSVSLRKNSVRWISWVYWRNLSDALNPLNQLPQETRTKISLSISQNLPGVFISKF